MGTEIKLGNQVRCKITGFKGTAVAKTEFLNGCIQYTLVGKVGKDNKVPEEMMMDIESLEKIPIKRKKIKKSNTGGPTRLGIKQRGY